MKKGNGGDEGHDFLVAGLDIAFLGFFEQDQTVPGFLFQIKPVAVFKKLIAVEPDGLVTGVQIGLLEIFDADIVAIDRAGAVDGIIQAVSGAENAEGQDNDNGDEP